MPLFCNGVKEKQGEDIFDKCRANLLLQNLELSSFLSSSVSGWSGDKLQSSEAGDANLWLLQAHDRHVCQNSEFRLTLSSNALF